MFNLVMNKIKRNMKALIIFIFVLQAFIHSNATELHESLQVVQLPKGKVKGKVEDNIAFFGGIPYTKAPVGELRWRAPVAVEPWDNIHDATKFGAVCLQPEHNKQFIKYVKNQSEDCLTLNVWTPYGVNKKAVPNMPVMVWIHGGAFVIGSGSFPIYNGTEFAKNGIVLVTINYRLGNLGFFGHPAITTGDNGERTGNFGLLDQIAALKWVQNNISAFGGDKNNVTIFGESAGAVSVNYLMTLPETKGLFHRAIAQSGGGLQIPTDKSISRRRKPSEEERTKDLSGYWKIEGHQIADKLRNLPAKTMLKSNKKIGIGGGPYTDGNFISMTTAKAFSKGLQHDVPYLAGSNSFEGSLMNKIMNDRNPELIFWTFGDKRKAAKKLYTKNGISAYDASFEFFGDTLFTSGAQFLVGKMEAKKSKGWLYYFSYITHHKRDKAKGVPHGGEIIYVFDTLEKWSDKELSRITDKDNNVSKTIQSYWINFAKKGNPNSTNLADWPEYNKASPITLEFSMDGKVNTIKNFKSEKLEFVTKHLLTKIEY
jgi:para-nitrobenzyl esterase